MKAWWVAILSSVLGAAAGVGSVAWDYSRSQAEYDAFWSGASAAPVKPAVRGAPQKGRARLELQDKPEYDFGVMTVGESQSHPFRIRNAGTAPLTLNVRETTCLCTGVELPPDPIPPGQSADVVLKWRAEGANLAYRHSAALDTSDPSRRTLVLSIQGQVRQIILASPTEIVFSRVLSHKVNESQVAVYAYRDDDLAVIHHEFLHEDTRAYFQCDVRPLTPEEVSREEYAKSGVLVTVSTKPGLPLGSLNQRLRLDFENLEIDSLEIPIRGSVVSDISLSTSFPKFDREANLIRWGQIPHDRGARVEFLVWVKGPYQDQVVLTAEEVFPNDVLQVTIGQSEKLASGAATRIPVTIEVPAGSRFANHLGTAQGKIGHVTFRTNHPEAPSLKLYVSFVVGDFD